MIDTVEMYGMERDEVPAPTQTLYKEGVVRSHRFRDRFRLLRQVMRFGVVGGLNTVVDLLILNGLLWLFPTTSSPVLLGYNSVAYSVGAVNSFLLNKYWTFGSMQKTSRVELVRFSVTTLCGIGWSSAILWLASTFLHPLLVNATVWANASKVVAIGGTAMISYLGMRLWVFVSGGQKEEARVHEAGLACSDIGDGDRALLVSAPDRHKAPSHRPNHPLSLHVSTPSLPPLKHVAVRDTALPQRADIKSRTRLNTAPAPTDLEEKFEGSYSISIVLPAYNEEAVIGATLEEVLNVMAGWGKDFEVIVVNDGSTDRTGFIVSAVMEVEPRVRMVTHERNEGYGATLVDGFAAATKELTFFMDSDGQFDIRDLERLMLFIDEYDAVIGYRLDRQDTWMRKLNAWGWKMLIRGVLGVRVRDIDCAFKLLHTDFLHEYPLETRGAMINAELLYKLKRADCTYREVGVQHLPRRGGRATGAKLGVIVRAFRELFVYARKWRGEKKVYTRQMAVAEKGLHRVESF